MKLKLLDWIGLILNTVMFCIAIVMNDLIFTIVFSSFLWVTIILIYVEHRKMEEKCEKN